MDIKLLWDNIWINKYGIDNILILSKMVISTIFVIGDCNFNTRLLKFKKWMILPECVLSISHVIIQKTYSSVTSTY